MAVVVVYENIFPVDRIEASKTTATLDDAFRNGRSNPKAMRDRLSTAWLV